MFDHTATTEPRAPHNATMIIHSLKLRELLETGKLTRLIWCDTKSMFADGLNKGTIDRAALQLAISDACSNIDQAVRVHQIPKQMPEQSSRNEQPASRGVHPAIPYIAIHCHKFQLVV